MKVLRGALLTSLVLGALAVAATPGAAVKPQTINLLEVSSSFVGIGGLDTTFSSPPKVGQGFVSGSDLYTWNGRKRGAHAGTVWVVCTFTKITSNGAWEVCTGAALLPKGQITVSGSILQGAQFDVPIVGGTGIYTGARGYVRVRDLGGGRSADTIVITG